MAIPALRAFFEGMLPAGDAPGPNPTPPGPSPPAPIAPGTPVVSHARTAAGRGCLAFYPHPNRSSSSSSSSAPASTSDAYTGLFSTGPNGTGSCLTAGPSNASALEVDTTAAAPAAFSGPLALSFGLCVTGNPAQQFKRADQGAIKAELLQHVASGQCVTVDAASRNVVLAPCASSDSWVLGSSGVLFVADSKHPKNSGTCATSPAARSLALASDAEYYGSHADDGADDGRDEGGDERGGGEGEHVLGWKPKWGSGYPAVRDLKAAIRYVRATSATYNVDPTRVVVTGGSAGATNSLAAGVVFEADYKDELNTTQDSTLLSTNLEQSSSVQVVYTHWSSHGEVDLVAAYDPNHVDRWSSKNAPVIEFHGDKDTTIPIQQAYDVQAIYNKTGVSAARLHPPTPPSHSFGTVLPGQGGRVAPEVRGLRPHCHCVLTCVQCAIHSAFCLEHVSRHLHVHIVSKVPYSMNVLKNASHGAWCYGCPSGAGNPSCGVSLYCDWMDSIAFPFITTHLNLAVE